MDQIPNYITAIATLGLLFATIVLALFTKRLTDSSSSPQVIAILQPSRWAIKFLDLEVTNTGNATAFDISIAFDPPLLAEKTGKNDPMPAPFDKVSVLKPGQMLSSFIGETFNYLAQTYRVTISWTRAPGNERSRQTLSYQLDLKHLERMTMLGAGDPAAATANELKKIREGILPFFRGSRRVDVDIHTQADRDRRSEAARKHFEEMRAAAPKTEPEAATGATEADDETSSSQKPPTD